MNNACKGLAGLIFGHKYQPRYSKGDPTLGSFSGSRIDPRMFIDALEASKPATYMHDVCVRCGDIAGGAK